MKLHLLFIPILIFIFGSHAFAAVGTITGEVIDKDTRDPLPWAQVMVSGTKLGTVTDKNGRYTINYVPEGVHTVIATMMGYTTARSENVVVKSEQSVRVNFELKKRPLNLGTEVIVEAERPIFRRDVTATIHFAKSRDMEQMPVRSYQEVIGLQPGVVAGHFRGGREEEVLYLVDGIPIQDPATGGAGTILPTSSIVAMTIRTGGFEAEYGKAMSGIVNLITREGRENFQANVWATFDKFGGLFPTYDLVSSEDAQKHEAVFSGPLSDKLRFFVSGNYQRGNTRFKNDMLETFLSPVELETDLIAKTTFKWSNAFIHSAINFTV